MGSEVSSQRLEKEQWRVDLYSQLQDMDEEDLLLFASQFVSVRKPPPGPDYSTSQRSTWRKWRFSIIASLLDHFIPIKVVSTNYELIREDRKDRLMDRKGQSMDEGGESWEKRSQQKRIA